MRQCAITRPRQTRRAASAYKALLEGINFDFELSNGTSGLFEVSKNNIVLMCRYYILAGRQQNRH